jgi:probable biosynthetic protein (TIGR04098 family)
MYRSRTSLHIGMPHTGVGGLLEVELLKHAGHLRWNDLGEATGTPASRQADAEGRPVYASFYYAEIDGFGDDGLAAFQPDDHVDLVGTLGRFGRTMLDGEHRLYHRGVLPDVLPETLPPAPFVRLSNVLVCPGAGPDDLRITTPANSRIDDVPTLRAEPDSYRLIKEARATGRFFAVPPEAVALWEGARTIACRINADRDLNGVGLVYFANYVVFMDLAERTVLEQSGAYAPEALDSRTTIRRRIGFYGNTTPRDTLAIDVEAFRLPRAGRLLMHHRIRRGDGRVIAVASAEKALRA